MTYLIPLFTSSDKAVRACRKDLRSHLSRKIDLHIKTDLSELVGLIPALSKYLVYLLFNVTKGIRGL